MLKCQSLICFLVHILLSGGTVDFLFVEGQVAECSLGASGVYVAISSEAEFLIDKSILRWIKIYWYGIQNQQPGDFVGLWDHDPLLSDLGVLETSPAIGIDGDVTLSMRWDGSEFPITIDGSTCLPYWAGYVQNGVVLYSSCLSIHPNWMSDNRIQISAMGIAELLLPGCHDAGSYHSPDLNVDADGEVWRWTLTQDESLWQNMVLGARYFDIRIAYYERTAEKFYVVHGDVKIRPLVDYLNQTLNFIESTEEIIIFDIHSLENGFGNENDNFTIPALLDLITSWLGAYMAPKTLASNPSLDELWTLDKRIIATFPQPTTSDLFWDRVYHLWGDVNDLDDLYNYMNTNIPLESGRGSMWSCMVEFTPSTLDVTLNQWGGLRGAANITNEPVTLWLRREWWTMVNIFSLDFIASSNVINTVIEANIQRYLCNITTVH